MTPKQKSLRDTRRLRESNRPVVVELANKVLDRKVLER